MSGRKEWHVITLAWGGISGDGRYDQSYGQEPEPRWSHCSRSGGFRLVFSVRDPEVVEGAWIIVAPDQDGPRAEDWIRKTVHGPMCSACLKTGEVDRLEGKVLWESIVGQAMLSAWAEWIRNDFTNLATLAALDLKDEHGYGSLDHVDPATYAGLAAQAGARVGRKVGNRIAWLDGTVTELPGPEVEEKDPGYLLLDAQQALIPHQPVRAEV